MEKKYYKKFLKISKKHQSCQVIYDKSKNKLYELITKADVVIGVNSTALIEAMIIGKPIITVNMFLKNIPVDPLVILDEKEGLILKANIKDNLKILVNKILNNEYFYNSIICKQKLYISKILS